MKPHPIAVDNYFIDRHSIKCSVTNCAHHCQDVDHCGLTSIQVGTHEANPTMDQCTDCQSYRKL